MGTDKLKQSGQTGIVPPAASGEAPAEHGAVTAVKDGRGIAVAPLGTEETYSLGAFYRYIASEVDDEHAFMSLWVTLGLILSFVVMSTNLLMHPEVFAVQESLWNDLVEDANFAFVGPMGNKIFRDVHSVGDFWSWLRLGAVPLILQNENVYSEQYFQQSSVAENVAVQSFTVQHIPGEEIFRPGSPTVQMEPFESFTAPSFGHYLRYNRVLGGIRLSQMLSQVVPCKGPRPMGKSDAYPAWLEKPCFEGYAPMPPDNARLAVRCNERIEWLRTSSTSADHVEQILDMEDGCALTDGSEVVNAKGRPCKATWGGAALGAMWLDEATAVVELRVVTFNPTYGIFSRMQVFFFFSRGGRIWKRVDCQSFHAASLGDFSPLVIFGLLVWLAINAGVLFLEAKEIHQTALAYTWREVPRRYVSFWNIVDWCTLMIAVVILAALIELRLAVDGVNETTMRYLEDEDHLDGMIDDLDVAFDLTANFRTYLACYAIVIILRLFKAFSAQARLALVSRTLASCLMDVLHFSLVFFSIFVMYSVAGVIIFGHRIPGFANLGRATVTTAMVVMGDLDMEELEQVGRVYARCWVFTFFIIIVLLMLNMLLAIIFETYTDVRGELGTHTKTLFQQFNETVRRSRQRRAGLRVSLDHIKLSLLARQEPDDQPVMLKMEAAARDTTCLTVQEIAKLVPGMPESQAKRLCKNSRLHNKGDDSLALEDNDEVQSPKPPPPKFAPEEAHSETKEQLLALHERVSAAVAHGVATIDQRTATRLQQLEDQVLQRQQALEQKVLQRLDGVMSQLKQQEKQREEKTAVIRVHRQNGTPDHRRGSREEEASTVSPVFAACLPSTDHGAREPARPRSARSSRPSLDLETLQPPRT